jgi:histidinol-phosphate aminotransferase
MPKTLNLLDFHGLWARHDQSLVGPGPRLPPPLENRAATVEFLTKRNLKVIGVSDANFLMVDWKTKTAKEMQAAFRVQGVQIAGAWWPTLPTVSRITIGSKQDMEGFFAALNKVVSA